MQQCQMAQILHTTLTAGLKLYKSQPRTSHKLPVPFKESHQQDQQTKHQNNGAQPYPLGEIRLGAILQLCKVHLQ